MGSKAIVAAALISYSVLVPVSALVTAIDTVWVTVQETTTVTAAHSDFVSAVEPSAVGDKGGHVKGFNNHKWHPSFTFSRTAKVTTTDAATAKESSSNTKGTTPKTSPVSATQSITSSAAATTSSALAESDGSSTDDVDSSSAVSVQATTAISSPVSSSAAATGSQATSSGNADSASSALVPNLAWKAGLSGYPGIESLAIFNETWLPYISWYSNYEPVAPNVDAGDHVVVGAPMLWGMGDQCLSSGDGPVDSERLAEFVSTVATGATSPDVFFGFYEPDCDCPSSSNIPDVASGVAAWNTHIAPLKSVLGSSIPLGSPSACKQKDQTWLTDASSQGLDWDVTSIHVNTPTAEDGIAVVEYFWSTFQKPIWVTELTCVDGKTWTSCGDQDAVNAYIDGMVSYLESNPNVIAYGANNGEGVPGVWNLMEKSGDDGTVLTATGEHYLSVIKALRE